MCALPLHKFDGDEPKVMMAQYAADPMGGGEPLDPSIVSRIVGELAKVYCSLFIGVMASIPRRFLCNIIGSRVRGFQHHCACQ
jgi:hypothetical protein